MYEQELNVALLAVQRAAILTKRVFHEKAKGTVSKDGASSAASTPTSTATARQPR